MPTKKISAHSLCVKEYHDGKTTQPHVMPIYATSSFAFENIEDSIQIFKGENHGHVYSRYGNPTIDATAQKIADLEALGTGLNAYGFMTSSGMSAISSLVMSLLSKDQSILTQGDLYGGTTELFSKVLFQAGIKTHKIDLSDLDEVERYLLQDRSIKLLYIETPANPTMKCLDIHALSKLAKKYGAFTCVDNTFCTPLLQQPLKFGIDFVIHSTTKYLNGHGNSIAGVIIGHDLEYKKKLGMTIKLLGTTCNAWDAWLTYTGMKTLALRMERHSLNASKVAEYLEKHPKVNKVNYNGLLSNPYHALAKRQMTDFGGMLSFDLDTDLQGTLKFINDLKFCTQAPTLGDVDTLVLHPATSSHLNIDKKTREQNGISDSLVRLSVGIEDVEDIVSDLDQALSNLL